MRDRWDLIGDHVASVQLDPKTRTARVCTADGAEVVVRATRALRCPDPLPTGDGARIVDLSHVSTDAAAILTLTLRSGDTIQLAGSGLSLEALAVSS